MYNIDQVESLALITNSLSKTKYVNKVNTKKVGIKRLQTLSGWAVVFVILISCFITQYNDSYLSWSIKQVVSSWAPSESIGKLKYVSSSDEESEFVAAFFSIDYSLPFANGTVTQGSQEGEFVVNGNGDVVVVAPYKSKILEINNIENKRSVSFDCGFSVKVVYFNLGNVGVNVGDSVKKGDGVGIASSSIVKVKVYFRGKLYTKIKLKDGKVSL